MSWNLESRVGWLLHRSHMVNDMTTPDSSVQVRNKELKTTVLVQINKVMLISFFSLLKILFVFIKMD